MSPDERLPTNTFEPSDHIFRQTYTLLAKQIIMTTEQWQGYILAQSNLRDNDHVSLSLFRLIQKYFYIIIIIK